MNRNYFKPLYLFIFSILTNLTFSEVPNQGIVLEDPTRFPKALWLVGLIFLSLLLPIWFWDKRKQRTRCLDAYPEMANEESSEEEAGNHVSRIHSD